MKVGIVSDSHDHVWRLAAALQAACDAGAEALLHCGDIVSPVAIGQLPELPVPLHLIHGNNTGDTLAMARRAERSEGRIIYHGMDAALRMGGRRLFLVHFPHYAKALAATGEWDVVFCGHSHRAGIETIRTVDGGQALVVNPGTVAGMDAAPTYAIGDLASLEFEIRPLPAGDPPAY